MVKYVKGLFYGLRRVAPSEEGYRLAKRVLLYYAKKNYVVVPAKQDPGLRAKPDLIAIPVDPSTMRPLYSKAIAVEVESCNEVEVHPEQVAHNWVKESVKDFAEVHTWTWGRCFNKLQEIYSRSSADKSRVSIFAARWPEPKPGEGEPRKGAEKEGAEPEGVAVEFVAGDGKRYRAVLDPEAARLYESVCRHAGVEVRVAGSSTIDCYHRALKKHRFISVKRLEPLSGASG
jgi:hypothetical protein